MTINDSDFFCERDDIFDKLTDKEWFKSFVKYQYEGVFFKTELITPKISNFRILQAHNRWCKDVKRISNNEYDGKTLDHFKQSALLCFWLRRFSPVSEYIEDPALKPFEGRIRYNDNDRFLYKYGAQKAAFDIGFRICRFFEARRADSKDIYGVSLNISDFDLSRYEGYTKDVAYVLSEKNVSPHTLNLIYKALFVQLIKVKETN